MRIFNTHRELQSALDLAADAPGAYRFLASYGKAGFVCDCCGAVKVFPLNGVGTGYGRNDQNEFVCYACCIAGEIARMQKHEGPFYCYVDSDGTTVGAWPGGILGRVHSYSESRSGWNGGTIARFHVKDVHGNWWQGRGPGRGMYCTLRPMKRPEYAARWGAPTRFKDLPIASVFTFAEQVGFSIGRKFIKVSQRCYMEMHWPGCVSANRYQVGTINVGIKPA